MPWELICRLFCYHKNLTDMLVQFDAEGILTAFQPPRELQDYF